MNRFRSNKKSFNDASADPSRRPSTDSDIPALAKFSSKTFWRNRKNQPESKPQVDLTTALPPSDDFRTSLLMPNLSARFSMLKEQDDPHSKIGKANDDSVLFPKRASRLDLFTTAGMKGIPEDNLIHAPIRPPFASTRTESYGSAGTNSTDEDRGMMSRARPGEGNTLFGGRQKIYKIPVGASGSTKSFGTDEHQPRGGMGGRALYGDDLAVSTFPSTYDEAPESDRQGQERSSDERSNSPPFAKYNQNRETTSSTNSGPSVARTSTAATSVASQRSIHGGHGANGVPHSAAQGHGHSQVSERPPPKSRRLYGQGLDQHMYDQQYSAMNRMESLHRQRANGAPPLGRLQGARSATNLNGGFQRSGPVYSSNNLRAASPPPSGPLPHMGDFDLGLTPELSDAHVNSGDGKSPPVSPPMSPIQDNTFLASLRPDDLGKATASGAFSKPSEQYSEQQYLQRQLQLQQGRESPSLVRPFSPSAASIDEQVVGRTRENSVAGPQPPAASLTPGPERSTSNLNQTHYAETPYPPTRNQEDQYNSMDRSFFSHLDSEVGSPADSDNEQASFAPKASYQNPVNDSSIHTDYMRMPEESSSKQLQGKERHVKLAEESISDRRSEITVTEHQHDIVISKAMTNQFDADSPTLGPTAGITSVNGLNGLVRAHLRTDSGQSSIYPEPSPSIHSRYPDDAHHPAHINQATTNEPTTFFRESTFSPHGQESFTHSEPRSNTSDIPPPLSLRARQMLDQATALRNTSPKVQEMYGDNKAQRVLGGEAPRPSYENAMTWQEQLRAHHTRGGSTETEKEREGLANELAERRRAVQDKLQSFVENGSRSSSPAPGSRAPDPGPKRTPFGKLRSKTSRDSLASKQEQSPRAMKMLGIEPSLNLLNGSPRPSQDENHSRPQAREQRQPQIDGRFPQQRYRTTGRHNQRPEPRPESVETEPSPPTSRSSRERSGSETSERKQGSRHARPKMIEEEVGGRVNMAAHPTQQRSQSALSGRVRSNSKPKKPEYFERRDGLPVQANGHSMNSSPSTPGYSVRSAPSMHENASMISNDSIPVMIPPSSSQGVHSSPKHYRIHRKVSINKRDISEPIFKSCTSSVDVVDLPPGANLRNGIEPRPDPSQRPPIPPLDPRRKRTQTLLQALGRLENSHPIPSSMKPAPYNDQDAFPAEQSFRRHRLRKSSSEGGHINVKARQQAAMAPSPAVTNFPQTMSAQQSPVKSRFPPHVQQPQQTRGPQGAPNRTKTKSAQQSPVKSRFPPQVQQPPHGQGPQDAPDRPIMF